MRWTRAHWLTAAATLAGLFLIGQPAVGAQQSQQINEEVARKVKARIMPSYPALAQKLRLSGKVRLELVVEPDGRVKTVRVLGGHPVLAEAATDAVKGWKFAPGGGTTTENVVIDFRPPDGN
jgi:TonB family protein